MPSDTWVPINEQLAQTVGELPLPFDNTALEPALEGAIDTKFLQSWRLALGEDSSKYMAEIIAIYFEEAAITLQALTAAVSKGDALSLHYEANTLKSSSATLGAKALSQLCYYLESIGNAGTTVGATELLSQVRAEYERVKAALQRELQHYQAECCPSGLSSSRSASRWNRQMW